MEWDAHMFLLVKRLEIYLLHGISVLGDDRGLFLGFVAGYL